MATPLRIADECASPDESWNRFIVQREAMVARSQLAACSGCDDCGIRCLDGIAVTRSEYEDVVRYYGGLSPEVQTRILQEPKTVPWPGAEESGATMTWCRYRDQEQGNCSVYAVRPTVCRLFGHTSWLPCPTGAVTSMPGDSDMVWNTYRTFKRHTMAEWDAILSAGDGAGARA